VDVTPAEHVHELGVVAVEALATGVGVGQSVGLGLAFAQTQQEGCEEGAQYQPGTHGGCQEHDAGDGAEHEPGADHPKVGEHHVAEHGVVVGVLSDVEGQNREEGRRERPGIGEGRCTDRESAGDGQGIGTCPLVIGRCFLLGCWRSSSTSHTSLNRYTARVTALKAIAPSVTVPQAAGLVAFSERTTAM
jgi:hypothetical protein